MRNKIIVTAALSVFILSISLLAQVTPAQRAEIEKTLTEAQKELNASIVQLNPDILAKYLSPDFGEDVGSGNIYSSGREAVMKSLTATLSRRESMNFDMDSLKVYVISPDSAYVLVTGGLSVKFKNGRHGGWGWAATYVWRKEQGGWKIVHIHQSVGK